MNKQTNQQTCVITIRPGIGNSAVRIFEILNRIVTSVFDLIRIENNYAKFEVFEYLPSPISYLLTE